MHTAQVLSAASLVALASACASAQITAYASGLRHRSVGTVSSLDVTERRLHACCLGSSGEDGVEVRLHSARGGGVSVDIGELLNPAPSSREIKIRPKGWDGTIKGNMRLISNPGAAGLIEIYDFSMLPGVTALHWALFDPDGNELASGESAGPILDWSIDVPATGTAECNKVYSFEGPPAAARSANEGFFDRVVTVTGLTPDPVGNVQLISVTPRICLGCPPPFVDLDSVAITGSGMPALTLNDAHLLTFTGASVGKPVRNWGTGSAHISEGPGGDLDGDGIPDLIVAATNIGSSGQDGISTDFGNASPGPGGGGGGGAAGFSRKWGNGHVTLMKITDDEEELRVLYTQNPATCFTDVAPDFSALGAGASLAECLDSSGSVLAVEVLGPGDHLTIDSCLTLDNSSDQCRSSDPAGGPYYTIELENVFVCSFSSGAGVPGVSAVRLSPLGAVHAFGPIRSASITSPDGADITLALLRVLPPNAPPCDPDLNQDGNVDQDDVLYLINVVGGGNNDTGIDPDFNQDGNVDQDDVTALINTVGGGGCP